MNIINNKKSKLDAQNVSIERKFVIEDRLNLPAMLLHAKRTEKAWKRMTFVLLRLNDSLLNEKTENVIYNDDETFTYIPYYTKKVVEAYKESGRMSVLEAQYPITTDDHLILQPGGIYTVMTNGTLPSRDCVLVNLIDFTVTCKLDEVGSGVYEKNFFTMVSDIREMLAPHGIDQIRMMYHLGVMTRSIPHVKEKMSDLKEMEKLAEAYAKKNEVLIEKIYANKKKQSYQNSVGPNDGNMFFIQLGERKVFLDDYYEQLKCGSDEHRKLFVFTPRDVGSPIHEDDEMSFFNRTSKTDATQVIAWRFIAYVFHTEVLEEFVDVLEKDLTPEQMTPFNQHVLKVSLFNDLCATLGFPMIVPVFRDMMITYWKYFSFGLMCSIDATNTLKRPEMRNPESSVYVTKVVNVFGPVDEFWETIGIPISKDMAKTLIDNYTTGIFPSYDSLPSVGYGRRVACLSEIKDKIVSKTKMDEEEMEFSFFAVLHLGRLQQVKQSLFETLKSMDIKDPVHVENGDIIINAIFFGEEPPMEKEEFKKKFPYALSFLSKINFFDPSEWEDTSDQFITPYVYCSTPSEPYTTEGTSFMSTYL